MQKNAHYDGCDYKKLNKNMMMCSLFIQYSKLMDD